MRGGGSGGKKIKFKGLSQFQRGAKDIFPWRGPDFIGGHKY